MKKVLKIISITAGILSVVSAVVLICIHIDNIFGFFKEMVKGLNLKINRKGYIYSNVENK